MDSGEDAGVCKEQEMLNSKDRSALMNGHVIAQKHFTEIKRFLFGDVFFNISEIIDIFWHVYLEFGNGDNFSSPQTNTVFISV